MCLFFLNCAQIVAQPVNDHSATAIEVSHDNYCSGDGEYTTVGATPDGAIPTKWSGVYANVWFKFLAATTSVSIDIKTGDTEGTLRQPRLSLHDVGLPELVSNGSHGNYIDIGLSYEGLTIGAWYYINVDNGPHAAHPGTFTLCVDNQASMDYPSGAVEVPHTGPWCSGLAEYTTVIGTPDGVVPSKWNSVDANVWFKFQATTASVSIDLKTGDAAGSMRQPQLSLHDAALVELVSQGEHGNYVDIGLSYEGLTVGNWYYINVDNGFHSTHPGTFTICVDNQSSMDYPSGAVEVPHSGSWCSGFAEYSTVIGTPDGATPSGWDGVYSNVWLKFQATTASVSIDLKTELEEGTLRQPQLSLHDGGLTELVSQEDRGSYTDIGLSYEGLTVGNWYYINVDNGPHATHPGTFTICIDNTTSMDFPAGAAEIPHTGSWCSGLAEYTTAIGTPDGSVPANWSGVHNNVWFKFQATTASVAIDLKTEAEEGTLRYPQLSLHNAGLSEVMSNGERGNYTDIGLSYEGLTVGEWYYINVDNGYHATHPGTFTLCLDNVASMDYVSGAVELPATATWCSELAQYSTGGATPDGPVPGQWSGVYANVWFRFQAQSDVVSIALKTGDAEGTLQYPQLSLHDSGLNELFSKGDNGQYNDLTLGFNGLTPGSHYYINIGNGNHVNHQGNFTLCVEQSTASPNDPETYYVNFSKTRLAPSPWNNTARVPAQGVSFNNLTNDAGIASPMDLAITSPWSGTYEPVAPGGAVTGNNSGIYPDAVIEEYYYFGTFNVPDVVSLQLQSLDPNSVYDLTFFGSSVWDGVPDNGSTNYTVNGQTVTLYVQNNNSQTVAISDISPNANSEIHIELSKATGTPVGYINALVITRKPQAATGSRTFLVDLGNPANPTAGNWNNVTGNQNNGMTIAGLVDSDGGTSAIGFTVVTEADNGFGDSNGFNPDGYNGEALGYPATAVSDSYFAHGPGGTYKLTGLELNKVYDLTIFGSRMASDGKRVGTYRINGINQTLDAENNTARTITFSDVLPEVNNEILLEFGVQTGSNFGYINVLEVVEKTSEVVLAPGSLAATLSPPNHVDLTWTDRSDNEAGFRIERRVLGAVTYTQVADLPAGSTSYRDADLGFNTSYEYRVYAYNSVNGETLSPASNDAGVTTNIQGVTETTLIYVNFADNTLLASPAPWNHFGSTGTAGSAFADLKDSQGASTGISVTLDTEWSGAKATGGMPAGIYPNDVRNSYLWTDADPETITFSGLDTTATYNFEFFASRDKVGNRNTAYSIGGTTTQLQAEFNSSNTVSIEGQRPEPDGTLTLTVTRVSSIVGYLNALVIQEMEVIPLPAPTNFLATTGPSQVDLTWKDNSGDETGFEIERSTISGAGYGLVYTAVANDTIYTDSDLSPSTTYYYRMRAIRGSDVSTYTTEVSATTLPASDGFANTVQTPFAAGQAGGAYFPLENAFDGQPTWDEATQSPIGGSGGNDAPAYGGRHGYIDFGPDYADIRITATWTQYIPWSGGDHVPYEELWWDDDNDNVNDGGIPETGINFNSAIGLPHTGAEELWAQDRDFGASPITPAQRYLICKSPASMTNRAKEYAIIGFIESASQPGRTFLLDLGNPANPTAGNWNNVTGNQNNGMTIEGLVDSDGGTSAIGFTVVTEADNGFGGSNGFNPDGYNGEALGYPATAVSDSYFSYGPGGTYKLTGLDPTKGYDLTIFGSRMASDGKRVGTYRINGTTQTLDAENNTTLTITFADVVPDINNEILLEFGVQAGSTFGYINVLEVVEKERGTETLNPPTNLMATAGPLQADLTWKDNSNNETGFEIERSNTPGSGFSLIFTASANDTSYSDAGLIANTTYYYRIRAFNATDTSAYSNEASVTTEADLSAPPVPENLNPLVLSSGVVLMRWGSSAQNVTGYILEKSSDGGNTYQEVSLSDSLAAFYRDTVISTGITYHFRVKSINDNGQSSFTAPVAVSTSSTDGSVPDDIELAVLKDICIYANEGNQVYPRLGIEWPDLSSWPEYANIQEFGTWGGITNYFGDIGEIDLGYSSLRGTIPESIRDLRALYTLYLGDNELYGSILPGIFTPESSLQEIFLNGNYTLTGPVPESITQLGSLDLLNIGYCDITGLPDLSSFAYPSGLILYVEYNNIPFKDLETGYNAGGSHLFQEFNHDGQASIHDTPQILKYSQSENVTIPNDMQGGAYTRYEWQVNDGTGWQTMVNKSDSVLLIDSAAAEINSNSYRCIMTNDRVPGTITSRVVQLELLPGIVPDGIEIAALRDLYENTSGLNWTNNTGWPAALAEWDAITSVDQIVGWHGVIILNGDVTEIVLPENNLIGELPNSIGNLVGLEVLNFDGLGNTNQLSGLIPASITRLVNLKNLGLSRNQLNGPLPTDIGNLTKLEALVLYENQLTGPLPASITSLTSLALFMAGDNQFSGSLPASIGDMQSLIHVVLDNNLLTGGIPASINNIVGLRTLVLHNNRLTGHIPFLGNTLMTANAKLALEGNNFVGFADYNAHPNKSNLEVRIQDNYIPQVDIDLHLNAGVPVFKVFNYAPQKEMPAGQGVALDAAEIKALRDFYESTNGANWTNNSGWPATPTQWDAITSVDQVVGWRGVSVDNGDITGLWQFTNGLYGSIPATLGNLSSLIVLKLESNNLIGDIPTELALLSNLEELSLFRNSLTGQIPKGLFKLPKVKTIILSWNQLTGSIPTELGELKTLEYLYLDNNQLAGEIPSQLGQLTRLKYLLLRSNDLTGSFPISLTQLDSLEFLQLGGNQLSGGIPGAIGQMSTLRSLSLRSNQFSGPIPEEIGQLDNLDVLALDFNQLTGDIPKTLGNLTKLRWLLLEANNLSGTIPEELGDLSNLTLLDLQRNQLSGVIPSSLGRLSSLQTLILTDNQLEGNIPDFLGGLSSLEVLQFNNNNLTGSIPPSLGSLDQLRILSFSSNEISGPLPSELGNLVSLTNLTLHHNNLSGSIPRELGNLINLRSISASSNQLEGAIPGELNGAIALTWLSLQFNRLSGLGLLKDHPNQSNLRLNVELNPIPMTDLEANFNGPGNHGFADFTYGGNLNLSEIQNTVLSTSPILFNELGGGTYTVYQWQEWNGTAWINIVGETSEHLNLGPIILEDDGRRFRCEMTNSWVTGLTLHSKVFVINVIIPQTFYAIASGNWSDPSIWSLNPGGAPENKVPTEFDEVEIGDYQVDITGSVDCLQVNINAGTTTRLLISGRDATLTVNGEVIIHNAEAGENKILQVLDQGRLQCK